MSAVPQKVHTIFLLVTTRRRSLPDEMTEERPADHRPGGGGRQWRKEKEVHGNCVRGPEDQHFN